jgi:hypothetical protein
VELAGGIEPRPLDFPAHFQRVLDTFLEFPAVSPAISD